MQYIEKKEGGARNFKVEQTDLEKILKIQDAISKGK